MGVFKFTLLRAPVGRFLRLYPVTAICAGRFTTVPFSSLKWPFHIERGVNSSVEHAPFARARLCSFFARYPDFKYDTSKKSCMDEFWRLVETYQLGSHGKRYRLARKGVKDAVVLWFEDIYGTHSSGGVRAWYHFFRAIGVNEEPRDIDLYHQRAKSIHPDICDLVDLPVSAIDVRVFPSESELSRCSFGNINRPIIAPPISKKLDPILGDTFRRIGNPLKPRFMSTASAPRGPVNTSRETLAIGQSRSPKKGSERRASLHKSPKKAGTTLSESPSLQNTQTSGITRANMRKSINPYNTSTLANPSEYTHLQTIMVEISNDRLKKEHRPPIGLFHPAFNSFQRRIGSMSFAPNPSQLSSTLPLLTASQKIYDKQARLNGRIEAFKPLLTQLLDVYIRNSNTPGAAPDGVVQELKGAYPIILDIGDKVGTGECNPLVEAAVALANYWRDGQFGWVRQLCCCPSMILATKGPWMCVVGGIMLGYQPVVQPLTPFFLVGDNPSSPKHANTVAKIFASLAKSLSELDDFYRGLQRFRGTRNPAGHFPYIQQLIINGKRVDIEHQSLAMPEKPVFRALARSEDGDVYRIIVKFAKSYNAAAHRLLAAMNLAPELLFVSSEGPIEFKVAQRIMVVMKEAPYSDLSGTSPHNCILKDVKRALDVLHKHNMVFGDLRSSNVLDVIGKHTCESVGGMLVDFDWCGTAGQATYPMDINMTMEWPEGVGPGLPMQLEHDQVMLERLSDPVAFQRRMYDAYFRSLAKYRFGR